MSTSGSEPPDSSFQLPASNRLDYALALLTALLAFLLYLRTLAPGLLGGDSGEFQFAAWLGGFAHPTGYPLYLLLGWLWTHLLPLHDPAWRMNAFSALWGGVATGLVYLLALRMLRPPSPTLPPLRRGKGELPPLPQRELEKFPPLPQRELEKFPPLPQRELEKFPPLPQREPVKFPPLPQREPVKFPPLPQRGRVREGAALFAALTFAVTPTFWSQATIAEVYTLNAALVAAILLGLVIWGQTDSLRALYLSALLYGLSLAHHRTTLLYLPAIAIFMWLAMRQQVTSSDVPAPPRPRITLSPRHLVTLSLLVLAPLLLYLIIPLRAPRVPYFQIRVAPDQVLQLYRTTLAGFTEHISGQGFGTALGAGGIAAARLRGLPASFAAELTVAGLALGLLGLTRLAVRARPLLALTGLSFLGSIGFNLVYGIGDIYGYYIPAYLIWALWMAVGLGAVCDAVMGRNGDTETRRHGEAESIPAQHSPRRRVAASPRLLLAWSLCLIAFALPIYLLVTNVTSHDRSRDATSQAWDALLAQPIPQDAILVTNDRDEMMPQWYLKYVEGRRADLTGLFPLIQPGPEWADVGAVTDQALRSGRPVYLIKPMDGLEVKFGLTPEGALVRVDGPAAASEPAQPTGQTYGDAIRLAGYDLSPATLNPGGTVELTLHWQPLTRLDADLTTFVHLVDADGNKLSQSDHRPGGVFYPTSLWKPGETLADQHTLALPAALGQPPYTIVVGLYDSAAGLQLLGEPQPIGTLSQ